MKTILYGECVNAVETTQVRIRTLMNDGCDLETDVRAKVFDADFALWIGAIGPIAATALRGGARRLAVRFKEPLDGRILQHFNG